VQSNPGGEVVGETRRTATGDREGGDVVARSGKTGEDLGRERTDPGPGADQRGRVDGDPHRSAVADETIDQPGEVARRRGQCRAEGLLELSATDLRPLEAEHAEADTHAQQVASGVAKAVGGGRVHPASVDGGDPERTVRRLPSGVVVTVPHPPPETIVGLSAPVDTEFAAEFDIAFDDGFDEPEGPAPAVVVVMVAHDPGWWFEETLTSLGAQDYPAMSVLVIDAASADPADLRDRVSSVLPDAHLRRISENLGFASAANEALVAVQGAAFYLFCHDDVILRTDAIRVMVEEAFRSNAGIVGPKIVEWHDERRLLSVGMGSDRFGQPAPYVERGDLDQEQHDAVRDVFYIPGAATLVRADLFSALGGFDAEMTFHGEDLDLCWRAHVAGARVIAAPAATVGHLEALGIRRPVDDRRRLQARHRLRAMRVSESLGTRVRAIPETAVLSLMEILQAVVLGHFRRARDIGSAWMWNFRHASTARERRTSLARVRRVPDSDVRAFQARGSARLSGFMRGWLGHSEAAAGGRALVSNLRDARSTTPFIVWALIVAFMVTGSRELLLHGVPAVGDFVRFLGPGQMLSRFTSGYQTIGLGSTVPAPTGFGVLGVLATVLFGAVGLLRSVLILGLWPLGAIGLWRFTRPIGSQRARLLATVAYVVVPVAQNAMAQGQWGTLVAYAALPWVLAQLAAASGVAPFGDAGDPAGPGLRTRPLTHRAVAVGLIVALGATIDPAIIPIAAGCAIALVLGGLLAGQRVGAGRILAVGLGGTVIALVMHLPWSISFVDGWSAIVGTTSNGGFRLALGDVLRFGTGPFGNGVVGWFILATAALPLFIGRRWRLAWAVRSWTFAFVGFGLAWAIGQGWFVAVLPAASMVLVPASIGIAFAAGLGMAAFEADLPDYHFGFRQIISVVAAVAFVVALLPALAGALSGRWDVPRGDYSTTLSFLGDGSTDGSYRVLWLGDASAIPLSGWRLDAPTVDDLGPDRTLAYATTMSSTPSIAENWAGSDSGATANLGAALETAADGGTARLGALLAPMAVRYVVVPMAPAPDPYARSRTFIPTDLLSVLDGQLDLASITVNPGVRVYRNSAWAPAAALLPAGTELPKGGDALGDRTAPALASATPVLTTSDGHASSSGDIAAPGQVYVAASGDGWKLTVDGVSTPRSTVFGWSNSFIVDSAGVGRLSFETPLTRWLMILGQIAVWILVIVYLLRVRVREDERTDLLVGAPSTVNTAPTGEPAERPATRERPDVDLIGTGASPETGADPDRSARTPDSFEDLLASISEVGPTPTDPNDRSPGPTDPTTIRGHRSRRKRSS
jgi:GT2 family glycosyltransferase